MNEQPSNVETVAHTPAVPKTADEVRHLMTDTFHQFQPHLKGYGEYAERMATLSQEYHGLRLKEAFPGASHEELTEAACLDVRETPKKMETVLAQLQAQGVHVKRVVFDRVKFQYHLFV